MRTEELTVYYGGKPAVKDVTLPVRSGEVLSLIGPSGCGKTTLLRTLNRLTELTATASVVRVSASKFMRPFYPARGRVRPGSGGGPALYTLPSCWTGRPCGRNDTSATRSCRR